MTASVGEIAARRELWTSFRSLLQAYLAAASLGLEIPQAMLLEAPPDELHLEGPRRTIKLSLQLRSGEGYWAVYGVPAAGADTEAAQLLDEGAFRLTLGAQFEWSGARGKMEMDALAEALVTLVLEQENSR